MITLFDYGYHRDDKIWSLPVRIAVIYSDKRGRYIANGFRSFCDVVEIDLSDSSFTFVQKILSAAISFHLDRSDWVNEFYRNPIAVAYRKRNGNNLISSHEAEVDAVIQFGVMNSYDYSLLNTNKVFYYHDGAYDKNSKLWTIKRYENWFALMQKKAFDQATGIFTFSDWSRKQHINDYRESEKKVVTVGWGPCLPVTSDHSEVKKAVNRLLFIGHSGKWKGLSFLLSAFQKIQNKHPDIILDVIGVDEKEVEGIKPQAVLYHGRKIPEDVIGFLHRADLLILPSLYERAGHVIVEAMWYGCPVIVTDTCGSPEPVLVGKCGLVVEPGDVGALYYAITALIEDANKVRQMSINAMSEARKNWSWKAVCGKMYRYICSKIDEEA